MIMRMIDTYQVVAIHILIVTFVIIIIIIICMMIRVVRLGW